METMEERAARLAERIVPDQLFRGFDRVITMHCDGGTLCTDRAREVIAEEIAEYYGPDDTDDAIVESIGETWWPTLANSSDADDFPCCEGDGSHEGHLVCGSCGTDIDFGTSAGTYVGDGIECYNCHTTGIYVDGIGHVRDGYATVVAEVPFYPRDQTTTTYVTVPVIGDRGMTTAAIYVVPGIENGPMGSALPAAYVVRTPVLPRGPRIAVELENLAYELYESDARFPLPADVRAAIDYVNEYAVKFATSNYRIGYRVG